MWSAHAWTLAHLTAASISHTALAWLRPRNSMGPGVEPTLTTHHVGTGKGPARCPPFRSAHPQRRHLLLAGPGPGSALTALSGRQTPIYDSPYTSGAIQQRLPMAHTERNTQEVEHLLPDSGSPPSSPACKGAGPCGLAGGVRGAGRRDRSHSAHHVLLSTIKTTPLG